MSTVSFGFIAWLALTILPNRDRFLFAKTMIIWDFFGDPGIHHRCIPATSVAHTKYSSYRGVSSHYTDLFMQLPG